MQSLLLIAQVSSAASMPQPLAYYRFENATDPAADSSPNGNRLALVPNTTRGFAFTASGRNDSLSVGRYLQINPQGPSFPSVRDATLSRDTSWAATAPVGKRIASAVTIELLLAPATDVAASAKYAGSPRCFLRGGASKLISSSPPASGFGLEFLPDRLLLTAPTVAAARAEPQRRGLRRQPPPPPPPAQDMVVSMLLRGGGVLAADYWTGARSGGVPKAPRPRKWSHIAIVADASAGSLALWIDGQSLPSMRSSNSSLSGRKLSISDIVIDAKNAVALCADIDEVAIFDSALSDAAVYKHYQDAIIHKQPYTTDGAVPPPSSVPANASVSSLPNATNASYYFIEEYAPGSVIPSPVRPVPKSEGGGNSSNTAGCAVSCAEQLKYGPDPRFNASAIAEFGTPWNFNWMDQSYMAGVFPGSRWLKDNLTMEIEVTTSSKYRYGISLRHPCVSKATGAPCLKGNSYVYNQTIVYANANPHVPLNIIIGQRSAINGSQLYNESL